MKAMQVRSRVRKIPWRRKWQPTSLFLSGKSHRQRSLVGYSPWGHKRIIRDLAIKQHHLLPGVKTFPVCSTVKYQVPSLTFPLWIYQIQGVQNASSDFSSETCLSLIELSHLSQQHHCSRSCRWQQQIYPLLFPCPFFPHPFHPRVLVDLIS